MTRDASFLRPMWPPQIPRGALDAAARKALAFQRSTFLKTLNISRVLVPLDAEANPKIPDGVEQRVKAAIEEEADALVAKHAPALPEGCARAPGHLQFAALAMAAQRSLLREARAREDVVVVSGLKARAAVADALGVVAPPDGTRPQAVPVQWVPNKIAMAITGALWSESRRRSMTERMMANMEVDLGPAFSIEPIEGELPPSRALTRCYYRETLASEGDDVLLLAPVFTALHEVTWAGVPGFEFECEDAMSGVCRFVFR
jgi:hypothetical protein